MSKSDDPIAVAAPQLDNDPGAAIERAAQLVWQQTQHALLHGHAGRVSDEAVATLLTAAIKLYARKADGEGRTFRAVRGEYDEVLTPTEALTAVTEVLRSLGLGPVEFALWSRRRPEDIADAPPRPVAQQ